MIKFCSSSIIVSGVSVWSTVDISLLAKVTFSIVYIGKTSRHN